MISLIIVQATGDKFLSGVACLLRCCAGPSICPVCVASSLLAWNMNQTVAVCDNNIVTLYIQYFLLSAYGVDLQWAHHIVDTLKAASAYHTLYN